MPLYILRSVVGSLIAVLLSCSTISAALADQRNISLTIQRDPFVSEEETIGNAHNTGTLRVPDLESMDSAPAPALLPIRKSALVSHDNLLGIIIGRKPYALVNQSGKTRLLSLGDSMEGHTIISITFREITLDDRSVVKIPLMAQ